MRHDVDDHNDILIFNTRPNAKKLTNKMKETYTQEEVDSIKMQIQEDIITYLDGMDDEIIDDVCQIVVNNFNIG